VLRRGLWQLGIGLALGTVAGVGLSRVMSGILVEIKPGDPATFIAIGLVLAIVSIAACMIPARRAARVDPAVALRIE
jgi:ABC-type antimicrobial peptide transport system permease subunit